MIIESWEDLDRLEVDDIEDGLEVSDEEYLLRRLPDEYVALVLGNRGGGKSAYAARGNARALKMDIPVFTNITMPHPDHPDVLRNMGITNEPQPADFDDLVMFKPEYEGCWLGIDEITTWLVRQRGMANSQILAGNWLGQIRKRRLKAAFTAQADRKIVNDLWDQADLIIHAQDACWTPWGFERRLDRGKIFIYFAEDNSGVFTGRTGTRWGFVLQNAQRLWTIYDTFEVQDPATFLRKYKFVGDETVVDTTTGEIYDAAELNPVKHEQIMQRYGATVASIWNLGFMQYITEQGEDVAQYTGSALRISISKSKRLINTAHKQLRDTLRSGFKYLVELAENKSPLVKIDAHYVYVIRPEVMAPGEK